MMVTTDERPIVNSTATAPNRAIGGRTKLIQGRSILRSLMWPALTTSEDPSTGSTEAMTSNISRREGSSMATRATAATSPAMIAPSEAALRIMSRVIACEALLGGEANSTSIAPMPEPNLASTKIVVAMARRAAQLGSQKTRDQWCAGKGPLPLRQPWALRSTRLGERVSLDIRRRS